MYKFVSIEEYNDKYSRSHPDAVKYPDKNTVVLSMNEPCDGCVSYDEAIKHINENLLKEGD